MDAAKARGWEAWRAAALHLWPDGRTSPQLGQGATLALLDARSLARALATERGVPATLTGHKTGILFGRLDTNEE